MRPTMFALAVFAVVAVAATAKDRASYLKPGDIDIITVIPAAPVAGDPRYEADRAVFKMTRKFVGTPRWAMAVKDVRWGDDVMMQDFSCAAGVALTPSKLPRLVAILDKAGRDTQRETNIAKEHYKRLRPFKIDTGPICQPETELGDSYDYPSGHTTGGWTWALILADVVPDRASEILARGRSYGESRIVCGAHNASAVEAGRLSATVTLERVRMTPAYQKDLKAARAEFAAFRAAAAKPAACDVEKGLVAQNIFAPAP